MADDGDISWCDERNGVGTGQLMMIAYLFKVVLMGMATRYGRGPRLPGGKPGGCGV